MLNGKVIPELINILVPPVLPNGEGESLEDVRAINFNQVSKLSS